MTYKISKYFKLATQSLLLASFVLVGCEKSERSAPQDALELKVPPAPSIPIKQIPNQQQESIPSAPTDSQGGSSLSPVAPQSAAAADEKVEKSPQIYRHKNEPEDQPLFVEGEKSFEFEPFRVPQIVLRRQAQENGEALAEEAKPFHVYRASLVIDLKKDEMRLDLDIEGREMRRERIMLSGKFDRHAPEWSANLFASDSVIRNERRVQAVVLCRRPFICDQVYMDLHYVVKGMAETPRRQFNVGVDKAMIPLSEGENLLIDYDAKEEKIAIPSFETQVRPDPLSTESQSPRSASSAISQPASPAVRTSSPPRPRPEQPPVVMTDLPATPAQPKPPAALLLPKALPPQQSPPKGASSSTPPPLLQPLKDTTPGQNLRPRPRPSQGTPPYAQTTSPRLPSPGLSPVPLAPLAWPAPQVLPAAPKELVPPTTSSQKLPPRQTPVDSANLPLQDSTLHEQISPAKRPAEELDLKEAVIVYETESDLSSYTDGNSQDAVQNLSLPQVEGEEKNQAVGSHANGKLQNASELENNADCGILKRTSPGDFWATDYLLSFISRAACAVQQKLGSSRAPPLRIGTLSRKFGGRASGHGSHQNGLDADIYFYRTVPNNSSWSPSEDSWKTFDFKRNWQFLLELQRQSTPRALPFSNRKPGKGVLAIFVNPSIKKKFCDFVKEDEGLPSDKTTVQHRALKYLVAYYRSGESVSGHGNHYHIRLFCPTWGQKGNKCNNYEVSAPVTGNSTGC